MDVQPVDLGHELGECVELGLALAPIVVGTPVADDVLELCELYALRPISDRLSAGPARRGDASAEIHELLVGDGDLEGADGIRCIRNTPGLFSSVILAGHGQGDGRG